MTIRDLRDDARGFLGRAPDLSDRDLSFCRLQIQSCETRIEQEKSHAARRFSLNEARKTYKEAIVKTLLTRPRRVAVIGEEWLTVDAFGNLFVGFTDSKLAKQYHLL